MDINDAIAGAMSELHANARAVMIDSAIKLTTAINSDDPALIDATLTVLPVTLKVARQMHREEIAQNEEQSKVAI